MLLLSVHLHLKRYVQYVVIDSSFMIVKYCFKKKIIFILLYFILVLLQYIYLFLSTEVLAK